VGNQPIEFPVEGLSDGMVRLRLMAEADLPAIVAACQDPEIPRWTRVPETYGESEARTWFEQEGERRARGEQLGLVIVDPGTGRLEGSVGIVRFDWQEGRCELATGQRGTAVDAASRRGPSDCSAAGRSSTCRSTGSRSTPNRRTPPPAESPSGRGSASKGCFAHTW